MPEEKTEKPQAQPEEDAPLWKKHSAKQKAGGSRRAVLVFVVILCVMLISSVLLVAYINRIGFEREVIVDFDRQPSPLYFRMEPTSNAQLTKVNVSAYVSGYGGTPGKQKDVSLRIRAELNNLVQDVEKTTAVHAFTSTDSTYTFFANLTLQNQNTYNIIVLLYEDDKLADSYTQSLYVP